VPRKFVLPTATLVFAFAAAAGMTGCSSDDAAFTPIAPSYSYLESRDAVAAAEIFNVDTTLDSTATADAVAAAE